MSDFFLFFGMTMKAGPEKYYKNISSQKHKNTFYQKTDKNTSRKL